MRWFIYLLRWINYFVWWEDKFGVKVNNLLVKDKFGYIIVLILDLYLDDLFILGRLINYKNGR